MEGVAWAGAVWLVLLIVWRWLDRRAGRESTWLNRENIAVLVAVLGTKSIVAQTSAQEVLRDPVVLERIVRGALAGLSLLISAPLLLRRLQRGSPVPRSKGLVALLIYLAVCVLSVLYSVAPLVSAAKAFELTAGLSAVCAAALASDGRIRLRSMARFLVGLEATLLVAATIGFFLLPGTFSYLDVRPGFIFSATMISPFAHSNYLSTIGAVVAAYSLAKLLDSGEIRSRLFWTAGFFAGIFGTLLSSGRQGIVIVVLSVFALLWFRRRALFLTLVGPAAAFGLWLAWEPLFAAFARGRPTLILNLTGRVGWWQAALESWVKHPWTGYGYGAGGRFVALASIGRSTTSNVHSGYVEALVGVGILGVLPLIFAVGIVVAWSWGALREGRDVALAILIVPLALHTSVAQGFGAWLNADFLMLACLAGIADWWRRDQHTYAPEMELVTA
jgi:O-antigen ligase